MEFLARMTAPTRLVRLVGRLEAARAFLLGRLEAAQAFLEQYLSPGPGYEGHGCRSGRWRTQSLVLAVQVGTALIVSGRGAARLEGAFQEVGDVREGFDVEPVEADYRRTAFAVRGREPHGGEVAGIVGVVVLLLHVWREQVLVRVQAGVLQGGSAGGMEVFHIPAHFRVDNNRCYCGCDEHQDQDDGEEFGHTRPSVPTHIIGKEREFSRYEHIGTK